MASVSRVIVCGDWFRGAQAGNLRAVHGLFKAIVGRFGVPIFIRQSAANQSTRQTEWLEDWEKSLSECRVGFEQPELLSDAAVIGFELSDADRVFLSEAGVPWINLAIHPIRFLDDLNFEVTCSFHYPLENICTSEVEISLRADFLVSSRPEIVRRSRSLLICDQVAFDRSLFFDNRFKVFSDYLGSLDDICKNFSDVIYRPHPYYRNSSNEQLICTRYKATLSSEDDFYRELQSVAAVCAVSSSVLTEAPYFGTTALRLEDRAPKFGPAISYGRLINDARFWEAFLGRSAVARTEASIPVPADHLRRLFGFWSYSFSQNGQADDRLMRREPYREGVGGWRTAADAEIAEFNRQIEQLSNWNHHHWELSEGLRSELNDMRRNFEESSELVARLNARVEQLTGELDSAKKTARALVTALAERSTENQSVQASLEGESLKRVRLTAELEALQERVVRQEVDIHNLNKWNHYHFELASKAAMELADLKQSYSWRLTSPIRWSGKIMKDLINWSYSTLRMLVRATTTRLPITEAYVFGPLARLWRRFSAAPDHQSLIVGQRESEKSSRANRFSDLKSVQMMQSIAAFDVTSSRQPVNYVIGDARER